MCKALLELQRCTKPAAIMLHSHCHAICRFRTLTAYPSWKILLAEWNQGIQLGSGTSGVRKTVQLMQLEKDKQEGVQQKSTSTFKSSKVPWRQGIADRNVIRDRKILIYGMLQAEHDGENLEDFMGS